MVGTPRMRFAAQNKGLRTLVVNGFKEYHRRILTRAKN